MKGSQGTKSQMGDRDSEQKRAKGFISEWGAYAYPITKKLPANGKTTFFEQKLGIYSFYLYGLLDRPYS